MVYALHLLLIESLLLIKESDVYDTIFCLAKGKIELCVTIN